MAQKLIDAIRSVFISGYEVNASCSIGISIFRRRKPDAGYTAKACRHGLI